MRILDALAMRPLDRPPVWFMRQAGRYLPEYMDLRKAHTFQESIHRPNIAAEITLQPMRRFDLDAAIIFSDIMTPLEGMGIHVDFNPGPSLEPMTLAEVANVPPFDVEKVSFVGEAIAEVHASLDSSRAVIGFAGAPFTLLCYLLEGGGSKDFMAARSAIAADPEQATRALHQLAEAQRAYLEMQIVAGADVVQLFDSWAGVLSGKGLADMAFPAARTALEGLAAPTIYFAQAASHGWSDIRSVGATAYGLDWRVPLNVAWDTIGTDVPVQGNLDPAVLRSSPAIITAAVEEILAQANGRPGHIFNLGHGINKDTPIANVQAMIDAVRS